LRGVTNPTKLAGAPRRRLALCRNEPKASCALTELRPPGSHSAAKLKAPSTSSEVQFALVNASRPLRSLRPGGCGHRVGVRPRLAGSARRGGAALQRCAGALRASPVTKLHPSEVVTLMPSAVALERRLDRLSRERLTLANGSGRMAWLGVWSETPRQQRRET
jgi:hypothetical protein